VRELRKYIHTQTIDSRYQPKVLSSVVHLPKQTILETVGMVGSYERCLKLNVNNGLQFQFQKRCPTSSVQPAKKRRKKAQA
jgi:hypothetical protein